MSSTKKSGKGKGKASNNEEGKGGSITSFFGPKNSTTTNAVPSSSTAKKSGTSTARKAQCKLDSTTSTNGGCGRDYLHNRNNTALKTSLSRLNNHTFQQNNLLRDDTAGVPFHPEEIYDGASKVASDGASSQNKGKKRKVNGGVSKSASLPMKKSKDNDMKIVDTDMKIVDNDMKIVDNDMKIVEEKVYGDEPKDVAEAKKRMNAYSKYLTNKHSCFMARVSHLTNLAECHLKRSSTTKDKNLARHHKSKGEYELEKALDVQAKYPLLMNECILALSSILNVDPNHLRKYDVGKTPPLVPTKSEE